MTPSLDMAQTAEACGYSWERFRKVWTSLPAFPRPIKRPFRNGRGTYAWDAADVAAWIEGRKRAFGPGGAEVQAPANDLMPQRAHASAVQRQRAAVARMMARG